MIDENGKEYIELNVFLKLKGLAATGGQAKILIQSGAVSLNGTPELRNKKKLYDGDVITFEQNKFKVDMKEFHQ